MKGALSVGAERMFSDAALAPGHLLVFSTRQQAPSTGLVRELCGLEATAEHSSASPLQAEAHELCSCVANHLLLTLTGSDRWSAFATDEQTDGVLMSRPSSDAEASRDVVAIVNVVTREEEGDIEAMLSVQCMRYRVRPFNQHRAEQTFLPRNAVVQVLGPTTSHLTALEEHGRKQGYGTFLPTCDAECRRRYSHLFGVQLPERQPIELVDAVEQGERLVLPTACLASLCSELGLQSRRAGPAIAAAFAESVRELAAGVVTSASVVLQPSSASGPATLGASFVSAKSLRRPSTQRQVAAAQTCPLPIAPKIVEDAVDDFDSMLFDDQPALPAKAHASAKASAKRAAGKPAQGGRAKK